jgi:OOP family OmpA-OmpF porin
MFHTGHFVAPLLKKLPENFTVEFDMVLNFPNEGYIYPSIRFKLLQSPGTDKDGRYYLANPDDIPQTTVSINPGEEESSTIEVNTLRNENYFNSGSKPLKQLGANFGKPFHVAIWVQKTRFRMWMNGEKVYDIPQAIPANMGFNRLAMEVTSYFSDEEKVGVYLSNIRIADGAADVRNKLITEGNWSTNGIRFDVASDKIKPESSGVLKEIANVLKENPSIKIKIVGHTDSDGDDSKNLDLSKRRAAAVMQALTKDFQVEESRMQTDGMGESKPVADNKLKEGKAQNRRVEFIKLP